MIRAAAEEDLPALLRLMGDHAAYEQAAFDPRGKLARLRVAVFGPRPRLYAWVAEHGGQVVGYATASVEFATWAAAEYLHMDCLYLDESARGAGLGAQLLCEVKRQAGRLGLPEVQWQTPDWNDRAIRFYLREGAEARPKVRFTAVPAPTQRPV